MPNAKLQLIDSSHKQALYDLVQGNKKSLKTYFPITLKNNQDLSATEAYLNSLDKQMKDRTLYPMGIFIDHTLIGMLFIKNIDWNVAKCELGYFIDSEFTGQGITSSMVKEAEIYCFEKLKLQKIFLRISPENMASKRIAEKNGYQLEGVLRNEFRIDSGELIDVEYYGKLA